jgi:hypothetical protein
MSGRELVPQKLRQQHEAEIVRATTLETHGISKDAAVEYLRSPEGRIFRQRLIEADLNASASKIDERAIEQLTSGRELPRMEVINEPLVKLTAAGADVSPYSPFFARRAVIDEAFASGKSLHDYFGLPAKSESVRYRIDEARPLAPTEVFISRVAPTSELNGLVIRDGGAEQVLVPNRRLFTDARLIGYIDNSLALQAERRLGLAVKGTTSVVAAGTALYDGLTTAEQYQALNAQGNQFGADALLRRYEGRTAGGVLGGVAAGAGYGLLAGSETGPGAFITGAVGGMIGAFAGEKIATMVTEHKLNHQTGRDGLTYAYDRGQWVHTEHRLGLDGHYLPAIATSRSTAPATELSLLDYRRASAVTSLMLAEPVLQDTRNITLDGAEWHVTDKGWVEQVLLPHIPSPFDVPAATADRKADDATARQLDQLAANRQYNNDHFSEDVAKAYVMDYTGRGWSLEGPLPDAVTKALNLPSEEHFTDPVTGNRWVASGEGSFERTVTSTVYSSLVTEQIRADGEERGRLLSQQASARAVNVDYGRELIAQQHALLRARQQEGPAAVKPRVAGEHKSDHPALPGSHPDRPRSAQSLRSYSDPAHPSHALYQALQRRFPDASADRLVQFSAACHAGRIEADKLAHVFLNEKTGIVSFAASWPPGALAQVDLAKPAPTQEQSMQQVHSFDQQKLERATEVSASQMQTTPHRGGAGPSLGY